MRTLSTNWNFARRLRLAIALMFLAAGISNGDTVAYVAAAFLGLQALFNWGCGDMLCAPPSSGSGIKTDANDVTYDEIH